MEKIRFAIVGAGWRTLYFVRIARALPEQFEITGVLVRSEEKRQKFAADHGVRTVGDLESLLSDAPNFVVAAVSREANAEIVFQLLRAGVPVLCETPPAGTVEELTEMWRMRQAGSKLQVAEQYFLHPSYDAKLRIAREGYLGRIQCAELSALHEYHGISMLRLALGAGLENVSIRAKKYSWPIAVTQDRGGKLQRGETKEFGRIRAEFTFDNGTVGFYDFSGVQYHSYVRSRHFSIQGIRGEIFDDKVFYLTGDNDPMIETLTPVSDGVRPGIESISFAGKAIYKNPFPTNQLPEDETAIARLLVGMKEYLMTGREIYPLADALQDAYLTLLLAEAAETGEVVRSKSQVWKNC